MTAVSSWANGSFPDGQENVDNKGQWNRVKDHQHHDQRTNFSYPQTLQSQANHKLSYDSENAAQQLSPPQPRFHGDSREGSEADSLIDLYRRDRTPLSTAGESMQNSTPSRTTGSTKQNADENDRWIHRDKLAMIEIQELRAAGKHVPKELEEIEKQQMQKRPSAHRQSLDPYLERDSDLYGNGHDERDSERAIQEDEESDGEPFVNFDPRTPEEIAADPDEGGRARATNERQTYRSASTSRIPLPKSSPLPIPHEHIERSTPLQRKRGTSENWDEEHSLAYPRPRSRHNSMGSQVLLDDSDLYATPPSSSPTKAKVPTNIGPVSGARKGHTKQRSISNSSPKVAVQQRTPSVSARNSAAPQRPGTSSGLNNRPRSAVNRPEGEAPWIATMYKPDPRLPPDQQIIPTHAKRLMQEQWEREGKSGSVFDAGFNTLAVNASEGRPGQAHEISPAKNQPHDNTNNTMDDVNGTNKSTEWLDPPRPVLNVIPPRSSSRAGSLADNASGAANGMAMNGSGARSPTEKDHAGYSTMPRVQSNQPGNVTPLPSPRIGRPMEMQEKADAPPALQEEEEKTKEKGCGCCIVM